MEFCERESKYPSNTETKLNSSNLFVCFVCSFIENYEREKRKLMIKIEKEASEKYEVEKSHFIVKIIGKLFMP